MRAGKGALFAGVLALLAAPAVWATATDHFKVASDPEGRGYSPSLTIVLVSPDSYTRESIGRLGNDGVWKGPRYQATGKADLGGLAKLDWDITIERDPATRTAITKHLAQGWKVVQQGTEPIERVVGRRPVGTIAAVWLLTQGTPLAGEARYESGLAIPLCGRTAFVRISALTPSGDSAGGSMGYGDYVIEGTKPTIWNREQVLTALKGLRLEGNLPAARVTAVRKGRTVAGAVTDCGRKPLAGQAVVLQRQQGSKWIRVRSGKTTAAGAYSLPTAGAGVYRVVAGAKYSGAVRAG